MHYYLKRFLFLCIAIGIAFFLFLQFQTFVKGEFQRICSDEAHSASEYNKCFQAFWDEDSTLRLGINISIILAILTLLLDRILYFIPKLSLKKRLFISILLIFILTTISITSLFIYKETKIFTDNAHISIGEILQIVKKGWQEKPSSQNGNGIITFLVLGTNKLKTRYFLTEITDTMMLVSINTKTGRVGLFSIPRDIWSPEYQTKIDALYTYGNDRFPGTPEKFSAQYIEDLTKIKIDHTIVISPDNFGSIIDAFGGVNVNVQTPFVDSEFPDPNVDILTVHDPAKLYLTVSFQKGPQWMDSIRALEYVRSRHAEGIEGSDIARSRRQRQVIMSIVGELEKPSFYKDVARLGKLYGIYNNDFARYLPFDEVVSLTKAIYPNRNKIQFNESGPSIYPDDPNGSIFHPNYSPLNDGQWVFLIRDKVKFQKEVHTALNI